MVSRAAEEISGEEGQVATGDRPVLTDEERAVVEAAVQAAEQRTSAEIVPMIVERSGLYREARHRAGLVFALLTLAALLTLDSTWLPWGWHAANAVWLLCATVAAYTVGAWSGIWPPIIRLLTSRERMRQKVRLRAERAFVQHGLARTSGRNGFLLMLSLLERQVYVLADRSLRERISGDQWQEVIAVVVERMKAGDLAGGLCRGIEAGGVLLARVCPPDRGDNPNELSNEVIQDA